MRVLARIMIAARKGQEPGLNGVFGPVAHCLEETQALLALLRGGGGFSTRRRDTRQPVKRRGNEILIALGGDGQGFLKTGECLINTLLLQKEFATFNEYRTQEPDVLNLPGYL